MKIKVLILLIAASLTVQAQFSAPAKLLLSQRTAPTYDENTTYLNLLECSYNDGDTIRHFILGKSLLASNYVGADADSIFITGFNPDYDGNTWGAFTMLDDTWWGAGLEPPLNLSVNGEDMTNPFIGILFVFDTDINDLCNNQGIHNADEASITFRIKDVNGLTGPEKTAIIGVYSYVYQ